MEDIVAVEVRLTNGESRYFLTWGRIQHPVDPAPVEEVVLGSCENFALGGVAASAHLCDSLQAARDQPYFYECFFLMCQERIPFGPRYQAWKRRIAEAMEKGRQICYLGSTTKPTGAEPGKIAFGRDNL